MKCQSIPLTWWMKTDRWLLRKPQRIYYAWVAGGVMILGWLISVSLGPGLLDLAGSVDGTDYIQFHVAGLTLQTGQENRLYDFTYQHVLQQQVVHQKTAPFYAFLTPPFLAWFYLPLSMFPYGVSYALFCLVTLSALWASLRWLSIEKPLPPFLWCLSFFPVFANLSFGQNGVMSLFLLALTWFLWQSEQSPRKHFLAGIALSLLLFKPQFTLGLLCLWLLEWRHSWRALVGFLLGGVTLAGLSAILLPQASQAYLSVTRQILPVITTWEGFPLWHTVTWRGFFLLLLCGRQPFSDILSLAVSAAGLIFFTIVWKRWRGNKKLLFSAAIGLTAWLSPHALVYDWAILIVPAVLLWQELPAQRGLLRACYTFLWLAGFISGPLAILQLAVLPIALQLSMPVFGLIAFTLIQTIHVTKNETAAL